MEILTGLVIFAVGVFMLKEDYIFAFLGIPHV
jgi:hypothetical protein